MTLLKIQLVEKQVTLDDDVFTRLQHFKYYQIGNGQTLGRTFRRKNFTEAGVFTKTTIHWQSLANDVMQTEGIVYDHIDRNPLNMQRNNLRPANNSQNGFNRKKPTSSVSKFKGVAFDNRCKRKPWYAFIKVWGKQKTLGYFATEEEAAKAYNEAALIIAKEFAALNKI